MNIGPNDGFKSIGIRWMKLVEEKIKSLYHLQDESHKLKLRGQALNRFFEASRSWAELPENPRSEYKARVGGLLRRDRTPSITEQKIIELTSRLVYAGRPETVQSLTERINKCINRIWLNENMPI